MFIFLFVTYFIRCHLFFNKRVLYTILIVFLEVVFCTTDRTV